MTKKMVFVAMSGGVDSSVAALLLKHQGYDIIGAFMRSYNIDGCAERDAEDARRVAEKLKIPFYIFDFEEEYKRRVVDYMVSGYREGITPNPDVMCNKEIKFGLFLKKALEMGADYVATGHYVWLRNFRHRAGGSSAPAADARLRSRRGDPDFVGNQARRASESLSGKNSFALLEGKDKNKDQSYFLWTLTQEQLKHCLFPIGDYLKPEVREIAKKAGLPTAEKKDSQGICFLGKVTLEDFLKQYIPEKQGAVLNSVGEILGEHRGAEFYTIGQRHLGSKYQVASSRGRHETSPLYVSEKNIKTNTLVLAEGSENPVLYKKEIELTNVNFITQITNYQLPITVFARVRYRQPLAKAMLSWSLEFGTWKLIFEQPQKFVTPGQSAVFYSEGGEMLGGGIIL